MSSTTYVPPATFFVASPHVRPLTAAPTFPIRAKLLLSFGVVLVLAVVTGAVGLVNLRRVDFLGSRMYADHLADIRILSVSRTALADLHGQTFSAIIDTSDKNRAGYA